jgi:hypothetical protein
MLRRAWKESMEIGEAPSFLSVQWPGLENEACGAWNASLAKLFSVLSTANISNAVVLRPVQIAEGRASSHCRAKCECGAMLLSVCTMTWCGLCPRRRGTWTARSYSAPSKRGRERVFSCAPLCSTPARWRLPVCCFREINTRMEEVL